MEENNVLHITRRCRCRAGGSLHAGNTPPRGNGGGKRRAKQLRGRKGRGHSRGRCKITSSITQAGKLIVLRVPV